jgi:hypothetical protein
MSTWKYPGVFDVRRGLLPVVEKGASYTVTPGDCGTVFVATAAATFTLPAVAAVENGWNARFFNAVDAAMVVAAPTDKAVAFNDVTATSIAFSTASEKAGSAVDVIFSAGLGKYLFFTHLAAETVTPTIG